MVAIPLQTFVSYGGLTSLPATTSTRTGYSAFVDWYDNADYTGDAITAVSNDAQGKIYYAKWTPITYTISFDGGTEAGGSMNAVNAVYDEDVLLSANTFTRTGYTFEGWSKTSGGTTSGGVTADYADGAAAGNGFAAPYFSSLLTIVFPFKPCYTDTISRTALQNPVRISVCGPFSRIRRFANISRKAEVKYRKDRTIQTGKFRV